MYCFVNGRRGEMFSTEIWHVKVKKTFGPLRMIERGKKNLGDWTNEIQASCDVP